MRPADATHRLWPLPDRPWVMAMQWYDLLFMHWPLQPAEAEIERNTMAEQLRLILPNRKPLLHLARRLDVVGWLLERVT